MGRWLMASVLLAGALAVGLVAFLNDGAPIAIRVLPARIVTLPLGTALALAAAFGAAWIGAMAAAHATLRTIARAAARRRRHRDARARVRTRLQAERLLMDGDAAQAQVRLADAVTTHTDDAALLDLLAGASVQTGDVDAAIVALERARTRLPHSPVLLGRLRDLYAAGGRWNDALAVEQALLLELRSPAGLAAEGTMLCGLRYAAAVAADDAHGSLPPLLALTREHPAFVPAWVTAAEHLVTSGDRAQAARLLERGAAATGATILLDRLVALHAADQRSDRALRALARLRRHRPHDVAVLHALVTQQLHSGALDAAESTLAGWSADDATPAVEALRAECCRRRGRVEQANAHLSRALEHAHIGWCCRACGHTTVTWAARCVGCGAWGTITTRQDAITPPPSADLISHQRRSADADHCVKESAG